jgi:UDP-N-acetylmuramoyl-tripeptide--D-alanyl-D-alanine ligase
MNALASLTVAKVLGLDIASAVSALEHMQLAERWRMQLLAGPNGSLVINDAYNASPDSMRAALQTLASLGRQGHRTIAVLGEMAELGSESVTQHDEIGRLVVRLNIDQLFVVGNGAKLIHLGAMQEGSWDGESKFVESIDEALELVRGLLGSGDIVLVKSSKSANLRFLGDALAEVQ